VNDFVGGRRWFRAHGVDCCRQHDKEALMSYDQYGEWVPDTSDVNTSPDYNQIGVDPADLDTSTMFPDDPWPLSKD
jgi:hypothetical protein